MAMEKFCLKWNDFERNISSSLRSIRDDEEFFDVTLACEDDQVKAHKVILSACSPLLRRILARNSHQHPLLYLKGVNYKDLQAVLNFMYHGEVNVGQDDLNSFLLVAEELKVKGLTQNSSSGRVINSGNVKKSSRPDGGEAKVEEDRSQSESSNRGQLPSDTYDQPPSKRIRSSALSGQNSSQSRSLGTDRGDDDDIQEVVPVKTELDVDSGGGSDIKGLSTVKSSHHSRADLTGGGGVSMFDVVDPMDSQETTDADSGQMMLNEDVYGDGSYYDENGQEYEDMGENNYGQQGGTGGGVVNCPECGKQIKRTSLAKHLRVIHSDSLPAVCPECNKVFKSEYNLKDHMRFVHGIFFRKSSSSLHTITPDL